MQIIFSFMQVNLYKLCLCIFFAQVKRLVLRFRSIFKKQNIKTGPKQAPDWKKKEFSHDKIFLCFDNSYQTSTKLMIISHMS